MQPPPRNGALRIFNLLGFEFEVDQVVLGPQVDFVIPFVDRASHRHRNTSAKYHRYQKQNRSHVNSLSLKKSGLLCR